MCNHYHGGYVVVICGHGSILVLFYRSFAMHLPREYQTVCELVYENML